MKKNLKRNIVMAAVLLFVCAAVYLNWSYNSKAGEADSAMVKAEDEAMEAANENYLQTLAEQEAAAEKEMAVTDFITAGKETVSFMPISKLQ